MGVSFSYCAVHARGESKVIRINYESTQGVSVAAQSDEAAVSWGKVASRD